MIVDYYSRCPVVKLLQDMTATTVSNHFTNMLVEYGQPSNTVTDTGS